MREVSRIELDEGVVAYLQRLSYELEGLQVLNCHLIRSGAEGAAYERYLKAYQRASCEYRFAFNEIAGETLKKEMRRPEDSYRVDFLTGELIVSRKEGPDEPFSTCTPGK